MPLACGKRPLRLPGDNRQVRNPGGTGGGQASQEQQFLGMEHVQEFAPVAFHYFRGLVSKPRGPTRRFGAAQNPGKSPRTIRGSRSWRDGGFRP